MSARHPGSRARDARCQSVVSVLTATACLSLIAAFRMRAACGLLTRTHARVACQALGLTLLELLAASDRPADTALYSKKQGSEQPETHCHHSWINLSFCRSTPHTFPQFAQNHFKDPRCSKNQKKLTRARQINGTCKTNQLKKQHW